MGWKLFIIANLTLRATSSLDGVEAILPIRNGELIASPLAEIQL